MAIDDRQLCTHPHRLYSVDVVNRPLAIAISEDDSFNPLWYAWLFVNVQQRDNEFNQVISCHHHRLEAWPLTTTSIGSAPVTWMAGDQPEPYEIVDSSCEVVPGSVLAAVAVSVGKD